MSSFPTVAFRFQRIARKKPTAFTLVELLVSMAVLALLILLVTQLIGGAAATATGGQKRMDAETQARLVLDRLSQDFAKMLKREDVDYSFAKADTKQSDPISFYGETSGYESGVASGRCLSVIGYRMNANRLERGARAIGFSGMAFSASQTLQTPNTLPPVEVSTPSNYEVLGDQIFRMEYCFLTKGNTPVLTAVTPGKISDIAAIVVAIAVLDTKSRVLVSQAQLTQLANAFPDAAEGQDIATLWAPVASNIPASAGIPSTVASAVRIYQRYYYLSSRQ